MVWMVADLGRPIQPNAPTLRETQSHALSANVPGSATCADSSGAGSEGLRPLDSREEKDPGGRPKWDPISGEQNGEHFGSFLRNLDVLNGIEPELKY